MLFGLDFCHFFGLILVLKDIFLCFFLEIFLLFFHRDFDTDFYGFRDFGIVTMLIFLVLWDYLQRVL